MPAEKPVSTTVFPWLQRNLPAGALGALTGTDCQALRAAVQIIGLYAFDGSPRVAEAFALVVLRMQPSTRYFAFHAIAHVLDWSDRGRIWVEAGLNLEDVRGRPECKGAK